MTADTVVIVRKDHTIPEAFQKVLLNKHKTAFSFAAKDKDSVQVIRLTPNKDDLTDNLVALQRSFAGEVQVFHFSNAEDGTINEQPYPLIVDKGNVLLAAILEGEFNQYAQAESTYANEHFVVQEWLSELCKTVYAECEGDMTKTMTKLANLNKTFINSALRPRGVIVLISSAGDPQPFSFNSEQGKEFPWGYASKTHDYEELPESVEPETPATEPEVTKPEVKESVQEMLARRKREKEGTPAKAAAVEAGAASPVDKKTSVPAAGKTEEIKKNLGGISCPDNLSGKNRKMWYFQQFKFPDDELPVGWDIVGKNRILVPLEFLNPKSPLGIAHAKATTKPAENGKTAEVQTTNVSVPPQVPGGQKKTFIDMWKAGLPMIDAEAPQAHELDGQQPFSTQMQIPLGELLRVKFDGIRKIVGSSGMTQLVACWIHELNMELIKAKPELLKNSVSDAEDMKLQQEAAELEQQMKEANEKMAALKAKQAAAKQKPAAVA